MQSLCIRGDWTLSLRMQINLRGVTNFAILESQLPHTIRHGGVTQLRFPPAEIPARE